VFEHNRLKVADASLLILAKPNDRQPSRLGLVVAKKNIPTAVQRNLLKRVVRETFRQHQFEIPMDIVFLARAGANNLAAKQLTMRLRRSWETLARRSKRVQCSKSDRAEPVGGLGIHRA
jgi:ribonuclease P protein component